MLLPDFKSYVFTDERNLVEDLTSARDEITDMTGTPDVERNENRLVFYFRDREISDGKKTVLIPCSIQDGGFNSDENEPRWYIACIRSLGDNKIDCNCIKPRDCNLGSFDQKSIRTILENPDMCALLAKKQMSPEEKESIGRFVEQQNEADEIIANAIRYRNETRIDADSISIQKVQSFLKHLGNDGLLEEFTRLAKNRQIMEILKLEKPHAGGAGIYLVNESDFKKRFPYQIVHALFAKCGLFHEENALMEKVFNEWALEAVRHGWCSEDYEVDSSNKHFIEIKLTKWGNKQLFEKAKNASFENRWNDPYKIDYYGDVTQNVLEKRIQVLLRTIKPGESKNVDQNILFKSGISILEVEYEEIVDAFFEVCAKKDSTFCIREYDDSEIRVYNYGSEGRKRKEDIRNFLETKIPASDKIQLIKFETLKKETGATYEEISYLIPELCTGQLYHTIQRIDNEGIIILQTQGQGPRAVADTNEKKAIMLGTKKRWMYQFRIAKALPKLLVEERAEEYLRKVTEPGKFSMILLSEWQKETKSLDQKDALNLLYSLCTGLDSEHRMESYCGEDHPLFGSLPHLVLYRYDAKEHIDVREKNEVIQRFLEEMFKRNLSGQEGSLLFELRDFEATDGRSKHLTKKDIADLVPEVCFALGSEFVLADIFKSSATVRVNNYAKSVKAQENLSISEKIKRQQNWRESLRKTLGVIRKTLGVIGSKRGRSESPGKNADDARLLICSSRYLRALLDIRGWFTLEDYVIAYKLDGKNLGFKDLTANPKDTLRANLLKLDGEFLDIDKRKFPRRYSLTKKGADTRKNLSLYEDLDDVTKIDTASHEIKALLSSIDDGPVFFMPQELIISEKRCRTLAKEYNHAKFVLFNQYDMENLDTQLAKYATQRKVVVTIGAEYENIKDVYEKHENLMPLNFSKKNTEDVLNLHVKETRRRELEKTVISIALLTGALPAEGYMSTCSYSTLSSLLKLGVLESATVEAYINNLMSITAGNMEGLKCLIQTQLNPIMPYNVEEMKFIVNILIAA